MVMAGAPKRAPAFYGLEGSYCRRRNRTRPMSGLGALLCSRKGTYFEQMHSIIRHAPRNRRASR
jgi:hypothetical protein